MKKFPSCCDMQCNPKLQRHTESLNLGFSSVDMKNKWAEVKGKTTNVVCEWGSRMEKQAWVDKTRQGNLPIGTSVS